MISISTVDSFQFVFHFRPSGGFPGNPAIVQVETIGDAYMVVSSVPEPTEDHADRLVMLGLEMVAISRKVQSPVPGHKLEVRTALRQMYPYLCLSLFLSLFLFLSFLQVPQS